MGDASPFPTQAHLEGNGITSAPDHAAPSPREINVLVTGFGAFRSFAINPSWLIASDLSRHLDPEAVAVASALKEYSLDPRRGTTQTIHSHPYKINVHVYPVAIRVAYDVVRRTVPTIITDPEPSVTPSTPPDFVKPAGGFDFVLHIGMAAGRDTYTLETVAHRDHYKLKDVDDRDGAVGEIEWRSQDFPEVLDIGWDKEDVLARWEVLVRQREDEYERGEMRQAGWREDKPMTLVETARLRSQVFLGKGKRAVVKLSRDAGRYLCEYIFYTGLATRWKEARDEKGVGQGEDRQRDTGVDGGRGKSRAEERVGKVAFLHVPGPTGKHDIARGVRVAESAILALVSSWEDGFRNHDTPGQDLTLTREEQQRLHIALRASSDMYDAKGTGDR